MAEVMYHHRTNALQKKLRNNYLLFKPSSGAQERSMAKLSPGHETMEKEIELLREITCVYSQQIRTSRETDRSLVCPACSLIRDYSLRNLTLSIPSLPHPSTPVPQPSRWVLDKGNFQFLSKIEVS
jgi:hypothetical protein